MNEPLPAILIVDDNEDNRYLLVRRLRHLGYETVLTAGMGSRRCPCFPSSPWISCSSMS